ncbi:MAG: thrombospondin, partial [Fibrobacter sp.]|nr:thrombospondin [Fibrobacter sp.]
MKKLLAALSLMCIPALAQVGIVRSTSGIHAPSAKTLPQGFLYISGAFEMVSDGNPLSLDGGYTDSKGNFVTLEKNTPSNDETFYA